MMYSTHSQESIYIHPESTPEGYSYDAHRNEGLFYIPLDDVGELDRHGHGGGGGGRGFEDGDEGECECEDHSDDEAILQTPDVNVAYGEMLQT